MRTEYQMRRRGMPVLPGFEGMNLQHVFVVSQGIGSDGPWMVFEKKPNGSLRRITSRYLPERKTKEEAEEDLKKWLKR